MRIIINTSHQRFGGAIQVALSFIQECKNFPENEYHVFVGYGVGKSLIKADFPSNFTFYDFDFGVIGFSTIKSIQSTLRPLEQKINPNVIISTSGPTYYNSIAPQIIGFNLPLYIYPESPFVANLPFKKKLILLIKKQIHFYYFKRDASAYVVQTDDVNQRVRAALKTDKVFTVTNTHNQYYLNPKLESKRLESRSNIEFRFLTLTSYYPHKDLEIIPKIAEILQSRGITNVRFVLTLKQEDFDKRIGQHPYIFNVGPILPKECPSLYLECDAMFLPTLAECFSASYPEAMVTKRPIITTNLGFAKSICGEAALYFEAKSPTHAADKIVELINDNILQLTLIKHGVERLESFDSARRRAEKYLELCARFSTKTS